RGGSCLQGEGEAELAAEVGQVLGVDFALVGVDDFAADGEAEAGAFFAAGGFGGESAEVLEEQTAFVVGDAGAFVAHGHAAVAVGGVDGDGDHGAGGGVFDGVAEEVGGDLGDFVGVEADGAGGGRGFVEDGGEFFGGVHAGEAHGFFDEGG